MMKKYSLIAVAVFLVASNLQATTIIRKAPKEVICECMGTYARLSFEVADRMLTNVKVLNSSSSATCDEWHIRRLTSSTTANHPDGVTGIGVVGYTAKDKNIDYDQCLKTDEIEIDGYWFVEETSIDLERVNDKK